VIVHDSEVEIEATRLFAIEYSASPANIPEPAEKQFFRNSGIKSYSAALF